MAYEPPDPPVVPYLMVHDGPGALDWYVRALGAEVLMRINEADGRLGHAALSVNGGVIYLADKFPELQDRIGARALPHRTPPGPHRSPPPPSPVGRGLEPKTLGSTTVSVALAVDDVDAWVTRAAAESAVVIKPAMDEFYGRHAKLTDPFGHVWSMIGPKTGA